MNRVSVALLGGNDPDQTKPVIHIQLLHVPECPLVGQVRATLRSSLSKANVRATIEEIEGPYPSPTLLIDGIDVAGRATAPGLACRIDLPTQDQVIVALGASIWKAGL